VGPADQPIYFFFLGDQPGLKAKAKTESQPGKPPAVCSTGPGLHEVHRTLPATRGKKRAKRPALHAHAPCLPHVPPSATTSPTSCSDGPFFSRVLCSSTTPALGLQSICAPAASLAPRLLLTFPETHVAKQIAVAQAQGSSTATGAERCESLAPLQLALPGRPAACTDLATPPCNRDNQGPCAQVSTL